MRKGHCPSPLHDYWQFIFQNHRSLWFKILYICLMNILVFRLVEVLESNVCDQFSLPPLLSLLIGEYLDLPYWASYDTVYDSLIFAYFFIYLLPSLFEPAISWYFCHISVTIYLGSRRVDGNLFGEGDIHRTVLRWYLFWIICKSCISPFSN